MNNTPTSDNEKPSRNKSRLGAVPSVYTPTSDELEYIIYCDTGCATNGDPADGFGYCTCGAEDQKKRIHSLIASCIPAKKRMYVGELEEEDIHTARHHGWVDGYNDAILDIKAALKSKGLLG